ncbi:unnamed protein product [Rotaria sp. Silwood1]|nr:unnamed protein product [Rotaria sp. Silwood1]CAF0901568.1 unnamed protein product [Rotaria sp. Silwood1]CAF3371092.1 unnamed protein product [Rotaria sp. Silwood1]CAF3374381.1 unnamed protein product [Rotaria sp. Silwood1]CAF3390278.1 unnamed protein product [Rotaria sp. Silwood1]
MPTILFHLPQTYTSMTSRKRFKRDVTLFESLPNELFVDVFSYLSDVDAVYAFSRLNKRFQHLILNYCYTFDFKSVNKTKFTYVIQQHDIHRWQSLRLSDDNNAPGQVTYFCQLFSFTENISQLKALSIINIKPNTESLFLSNLTSFTHLVSLSIGSVCGKTIPFLELPTLKNLVINSCMHSSWMKNLELKSLQHTIEHHCNHEHNLTWPITLKRLRVYFRRTGDSELVRVSLKDLSQLTYLSIFDTAWESPAPDGQIWEKLITSSMPLLENFKFYFKFWRDFNLTSDMNRIISTFSTPFYLQEKSWFIQCDANRHQFSIAILYSLPFAFEYFEIVTHSFDDSISTLNTCSSDDLKKNLYKNVKKLAVNVKCEKINKTLVSVNISDLTLKFFDSSMDWIFSMTHLCQLSLGHQFNMSSTDFICLLKNTPYLHSLIVPYRILKLLTNEWKNKVVCELLSRKIRSLEICSDGCFLMNIHDYVEVDELLPIVRVFSQRCRNLNITVYSRNIVVGLILRSMRHLRSLKVCLQEHNVDRKITKEWLVEQDITLKNLDCCIVENGNEYSFWFGRRQ